MTTIMATVALPYSLAKGKRSQVIYNVKLIYGRVQRGRGAVAQPESSIQLELHLHASADLRAANK